jgi:hypothetical protein
MLLYQARFLGTLPRRFVISSGETETAGTKGYEHRFSLELVITVSLTSVRDSLTIQTALSLCHATLRLARQARPALTMRHFAISTPFFLLLSFNRLRRLIHLFVLEAACRHAIQSHD